MSDFFCNFAAQIKKQQIIGLMKKLILLLMVCAMSAMHGMAQDSIPMIPQPCSVMLARAGDTYYLGNEKMDKKHDDRKYVVHERSFVKFNRAFSLPEGINEESIEAEFKNGILTVTLPKLPVEQPRKITVKIAG